MSGSSLQFDERDNVFAREDLKPGTPEYEEMYRRHPQWKACDDHIRSLPGLGAYVSAADMAMFNAPSWLMERIGAPDIVDGQPAPERVEITPERATMKVKSLARRLGSDLVGISLMNPAYAYSHRGRMIYPEEPWGEKITVGHRYAVSLGFREDLDLVRTGPYHGEMMETGLVYLRSAVTSVALAGYIRMLGYSARAHHFRNYQLLPVPLAVEAGLGELGRCGFLLTREFGNCLRLSTVTTDLPLICDRPVDIGVDDFCNRCKLCAEVCPSQAISKGGKVNVRGVMKWQIDPVKCLSYWNRVGTDCGVCIGSCPWTEPDNTFHRTAAKVASKSKWSRIFLLWIYPIIYGKYRPKTLPDWLNPRADTLFSGD